MINHNYWYHLNLLYQRQQSRQLEKWSQKSKRQGNSGVSAEDSLKDFQRKLYGDATPTKIAASNVKPVLTNPGDLNTDKNIIPERSLLENAADSEYESKNQNEKAKKTTEYSANKASEVQHNIPLTSEFTLNTTPSQDKRWITILSVSLA